MQIDQQACSRIDINELRKLCTDDTIVLTQHLSFRMGERGISYDDLFYTIKTGEIIEQYPTDYPFPSCLILGALNSGKHLHVVCGVGGGRIWVVTTYYPNPDTWEPDYKTRRGNK